VKLPRDLSGLELAKALAAVLGEVAAHLKIDRDVLGEKLFG
jgi:hypothetical protein